MARPETSGVTVWFDKRAGRDRWPSGRIRYRAKVTWPDGKRQDVAIEEAHCASEATATARAEAIQASLTADGPKLLAALTRPIDPAEGDDWVTAWIAAAKARGQTSTGDKRVHFDLHIKPALAGKHVRDWTTDDVRALVAVLDRKIAAGELAPKTARNIWQTATKMAADACAPTTRRRMSKGPTVGCSERNSSSTRAS